ncbi:MAG: lipoprotein [Aeromonadaceae bacterium]|nr:lipoprotein [Aeromonadaceae bacterium]
MNNAKLACGLLLLVMTGLSGCGLKGPLHMPSKPTPAQAQDVPAAPQDKEQK